MLKCPFCHFDNEDGALFCEQCKSDLAGSEPIPMAAPIAEAQVMHAVPMGSMPESIPFASLTETTPVPAAAVAEVVHLTAPPGEAVSLGNSISHEAAPSAEAFPASLPITPDAPTAPLPAGQAISANPYEAIGSVGSPADTMPAQPMSAQGSMPSLTEPTALSPDSQPRLLVLRGQKRNVEYPLYEGLNFIGRADEKPVDIDLEDQEPPDRIWCSRQHALITFQEGKLEIEDLNSANGTFVNRTRIYPGQNRALSVNDVVQIGNVQMKLIV